MVGTASSVTVEADGAAKSARNAATSEAAHIPVLDGLRGVAILLVVLHHFALYGGFRANNLFDGIWEAFAAAGWAGVDLFFVLSGFLITRILLAADRAQYYFRDFYLRRTLRIFPLYYATLALFFFAAPLLAVVFTGDTSTTDAPHQTRLTDQVWYWSYLINVRIAIDGWPVTNDLAHFWSLAIEEQFYLLWPFLVYFLGRSALVRVCALLLAVSLALRIQLAWHGETLAAYVLTPARFDALAIGALLALTAGGVLGLHRWRRVAWFVASLSAAMLAVIAIWKGGLSIEDNLTVTGGLTLFAGLFGSMLVFAVTSPRRGLLSALLTSRPLTRLGRYSYGLYVIHHPISLSMGRVFQISDLPIVLGSQAPAFLLYALLGGGISLGIAMLSWHYLEAPFLRLKERFRHGARAPAVVLQRS